MTDPVDEHVTDKSTDTRRPSGEAARVSFEHTLHQDGPRPALVLLNGWSAYRYTGIFRFAAGFAQSLFYVDRVNPEVSAVPGIPEQAAYCCLVRDNEGRFITLDALIDDHMADHPARDNTRSSCGVPLLDPTGRLLGTLCHFDELARDPHPDDLPLLVQAANALVAGGFVNLPGPMEG